MYVPITMEIAGVFGPLSGSIESDWLEFSIGMAGASFYWLSCCSQYMLLGIACPIDGLGRRFGHSSTMLSTKGWKKRGISVFLSVCTAGKRSTFTVLVSIIAQSFRIWDPAYYNGLIDEPEPYNTRLLYPGAEYVCTVTWMMPHNLYYHITLTRTKTSASLTKAACSLSKFSC